MQYVSETPFSALSVGLLFPKNMGAVSDEHEERFHQDMAQMEKRYNSKWSENMLITTAYTRDTKTTIQEMKENKRRSLMDLSDCYLNYCFVHFMFSTLYIRVECI